MLQSVINLLYAAEEALQKAHTDAEEPTKQRIFDVAQGLTDLLEDIEDGLDPELHPNFSVVPLDNPQFTNPSPQNYHEYKRHYEHKGRKLMVMIHRDFYEQNSWGRICVLDPQRMSWNCLATLPVERIWELLAGAIPCRALSLEHQGYFIHLGDELCNKARILMTDPDEVV